MGRPDPSRAAHMDTAADPPSDLDRSPLYLLAVLVSARRSRDIALEQMTRRRLDSLGVRVVWGDALPTPAPRPPKGGRRA